MAAKNFMLVVRFKPECALPPDVLGQLEKLSKTEAKREANRLLLTNPDVVGCHIVQEMMYVKNPS